MNKRYSTIIIDDEAPARLGLQNLLKEFPETFDVIDIAQNATEAQKKIEALNPDIIFLDIEMPGCTGFQLLERLETIPMVIFCTAYDQYSLEAFETNSIDYLVKPVKLERIEKTVQKLKTFHVKNASDEILKVLKDITNRKEEKKMTSITVKKNDKLIFIKLEDVSYFEADTNYTAIHSQSGTFLSTESISSLEKKLPDNFLRIHRSTIINKDYVKEAQKYFNSRYIITLNDVKNTSITSGRSYSENIKEYFGLF
ncbi:LytR/AlgR family response regulator transcription factor [Flavobacterium aquicola]|uniref:LytTR family two component transcriptional regulator n=1 Tax=Flavobacterium aquicola TaxID=1682742 RepID=A0A3E0EUL0_9FLAO|nr:LytTR family DNA-binding domain-containing protein [Flavobacterium aquicola]REH01856.1 LytTR family two component transcriptional regulator [Flavobacterium aquicola]